MKIQCPKCQYSREVNETLIPSDATSVKCPKCQSRFALFDPGASVAPAPVTAKAGFGGMAPPMASVEMAPAMAPSMAPPVPQDIQKAAAETIFDGGFLDSHLPDKPGAGAAPVPAPIAQAPPAKSVAPAATSGTTSVYGSLQPSFYGTAGTLFGIHIVNILLTILTLSIYRFWGKVKVRRYIYGQSEFMGDRFAYHGTGGELFRGWIKAVFVLGGGYGTIIALSIYVEPLLINLIYPFFLIIIPFAQVGVRRYRLSRTSWHAVRFSFRGTFREGFRIFFVGTLLSIITLGFYKPFFHARKQRFYKGESYFGDSPFAYDGQGRDLLKPYIIALLLTPFTLGLVWVWYHARVYRYDWEHTTCEGLRFSSNATGGGFLRLYFTNFLILILTLGLALPVVLTRILNFHFAHLYIDGTLDLTRIKQDAKSALATGEGMADFIELDAGLF